MRGPRGTPGPPAAVPANHAPFGTFAPAGPARAAAGGGATRARPSTTFAAPPVPEQDTPTKRPAAPGRSSFAASLPRNSSMFFSPLLVASPLAIGSGSLEYEPLQPVKRASRNRSILLRRVTYQPVMTPSSSFAESTRRASPGDPPQGRPSLPIPLGGRAGDGATERTGAERGGLPYQQAQPPADGDGPHRTGGGVGARFLEAIHLAAANKDGDIGASLPHSTATADGINMYSFCIGDSGPGSPARPLGDVEDMEHSSASENEPSPAHDPEQATPGGTRADDGDLNRSTSGLHSGPDDFSRPPERSTTRLPSQRQDGAAEGKKTVSFCFPNANDPPPAAHGGAGDGPHADGTTSSEIDGAAHPEKAETGTFAPPPHHPPKDYKCSTKANLDNDTVSWMAYWESLHTPLLISAVFFALRTVVLVVFPLLLLALHPNTRHWFHAGMLMPVMGALFAREILGAQLMAGIMCLQSAAAFMVWGVLMNAIGAKNNLAGWWCAVLFGPFVVSLFGDVPSKRFTMVYFVIIMQMQNLAGGDTLLFPCYVARDFALAIMLNVFASCVPFPVLASKRADDTAATVWKLLGLCVANITKSHWAPVNIDAKTSLSQTPFVKIGSLTAVYVQMTRLASYEPLERSLSNALRAERLVVTRRITMLVHSIAAFAGKRIEDMEMRRFNRSDRYPRQIEQRLRPLAEEVAMELMKALGELGKALMPKDVAAVDTDALFTKAAFLADVVQGCRHDVLYFRGATHGEVNMCLCTFTFHETLLEIVEEVRKLQTSMRELDPLHYKSTLRRAYEFFFLEYWTDFWEELPKRVFLATPRDVRIVKDSVKYALAIAVACAFTLEYDPTSVYFFGMAILLRLAQQTAAETLQVGVCRIFGLCIGAALSFISKSKSHNLAQELAFTCCFVLVIMCFVNHPTLGDAAQYAMLVSITGLQTADDTKLMMTRITDNVFAFIAYFIICIFLFPVDPIRVLWNLRSRMFISINSIAQNCVALASMPVTVSGEHARALLKESRATFAQQQQQLRSYVEWMQKASGEPYLRGSEYPARACEGLAACFATLMSTQELMLHAIERIHRDRGGEQAHVSPIFLDAMEVLQPFLADAGRIIHACLQDFMDSTDDPATWTAEKALHHVWKAGCAMRGLRRLTGNIQKNFVAAVRQVAPEDRRYINQYLSSSFVNQRLQTASALFSQNASFLRSQIPSPNYNTSFFSPVPMPLIGELGHITETDFPSTLIESIQWRIEDARAFGTLVIVFELHLKSLSEMLPHVVRIHEFEKSRH